MKTVFLYFLVGIQPLYAQRITNEKVLFNGTIYTCDSLNPEAEAVAIKGDKIIAVGALTFVKSKVTDHASFIDLDGQFLLPGLIDSHNHAIEGGERLLTAHLDENVLSADELSDFTIDAIRTGKAARGDAIYITGVHSAMWSNLSSLDSLFNNGIFLNKPVMLLGLDAHTAWCNKVMLRRAGVDGHFIDQLPGAEQKFYGRGVDNEPNGFLSEGAIAKVNKVLPPSPVTPYNGALRGINHLNRLGITAWLDPAAGNIKDGVTNKMLTAYRQVARNKLLSAHVATAIVADANQPPGPQIKAIGKLRRKFGHTQNLSVLGFKIFADGVLEYPTQTAAVSIPYLNSGMSGSLMVDPEKLKTFVVGADQNGLLVHIHAIGDRAVTVSLDAIEEVRMVNGNDSTPHTITHLQIVTPDDIGRFSTLGVLASMQLLWATADRYAVDLVEPYLDPGLYAHQYPARSLVRAGAVLCGASDWPVTSANPFEAIATAETRKGPEGVLNPAESVSRPDMIMAYTINAARALKMEQLIGSIVPGKQADFVLLDRDVYAVDSDSIRQTQVIWTMFGGEVVYQKAQ